MRESFEIGFEDGAIKALRLMMVELAKSGFCGEAVEAAAMSTLNQLYTTVLPNHCAHKGADQLREIMREINGLTHGK